MRTAGETRVSFGEMGCWLTLGHSHIVPVRQRPRTRTFMGTMRLHWVLSMSVPSPTRTGVPRISNPAILNIVVDVVVSLW